MFAMSKDQIVSVRVTEKDTPFIFKYQAAVVTSAGKTATPSDNTEERAIARAVEKLNR